MLINKRESLKMEINQLQSLILFKLSSAENSLLIPIQLLSLKRNQSVSPQTKKDQLSLMMTQRIMNFPEMSASIFSCPTGTHFDINLPQSFGRIHCTANFIRSNMYTKVDILPSITTFTKISNYEDILFEVISCGKSKCNISNKFISFIECTFIYSLPIYNVQ